MRNGCPGRVLGVAMLAAMLASASRAGDGRVEINHTCALQTGCFAGDTAGYPVTITGAAGRSYLLTSDLALATAATDGIRVQADDVRIDLGGFRIVGPVACSGAPAICTGAGSGRGIFRDTATRRGLEIANGSVIGVGATAISAGPDCVVRDVRVQGNGFAGLFAGRRCRIEGVSAVGNADEGIGGDSSSVLRGNVASDNGAHGIVALDSVISENTTHTNGQVGIIAQGDSTVVGNVAKGNLRNGIEANDESILRANVANENAQYGIFMGGDAAYSHNLAVGNGLAPLFGGNDVGGNHCAGPGTVSPTCP